MDLLQMDDSTKVTLKLIYIKETDAPGLLKIPKAMEVLSFDMHDKHDTRHKEKKRLINQVLECVKFLDRLESCRRTGDLAYLNRRFSFEQELERAVLSSDMINRPFYITGYILSEKENCRFVIDLGEIIESNLKDSETLAEQIGYDVKSITRPYVLLFHPRKFEKFVIDWKEIYSYK